MRRAVALPNGSSLVFDAPSHTYAIDGVACRSVSSVLDSYFPFDALGVSERLAATSGRTAQDIRALWARRATIGTNVHAFIEQKIKRLPIPPPVDLNGDEHLYYPVANGACDLVLEQYEPVGIELMIGSRALQLAGTIDFLGRNRRTGGLLIGDWKTSGSAESEFQLARWQRPAEPPLQHLPNEKFYRYALQILTYGYMLRKEGYLDAFHHPHGVPLEFGIIQMSKQIDEQVGVKFKRVTPSTIIPVDTYDHTSCDDVLRSVLMPPSSSSSPLPAASLTNDCANTATSPASDDASSASNGSRNYDDHNKKMTDRRKRSPARSRSSSCDTNGIVPPTKNETKGSTGKKKSRNKQNRFGSPDY